MAGLTLVRVVVTWTEAAVERVRERLLDLGVRLHGVEPDWQEIAALLEQAWRMRAGKRAIAAHDAEAGGSPLTGSS